EIASGNSAPVEAYAGSHGHKPKRRKQLPAAHHNIKSHIYLPTSYETTWYSVHAIRTRANTVTQHTDGSAILGGSEVLSCRGTCADIRIGDRTERERNLSHGICEREHLGLTRRQLEGRGRGVAIGGLVAFLGLDLLANGEHAHVAEQEVADVVLLVIAAAH